MLAGGHRPRLQQPAHGDAGQRRAGPERRCDDRRSCARAPGARRSRPPRGAADLAAQMLAYSGQGPLRRRARSTCRRWCARWTRCSDGRLQESHGSRSTSAATCPPIEADATQLRQVVMNLITNASEAIGERERRDHASRTGVAGVRPRPTCARPTWPTSLRPGRYVFLEVADTGCGMDAATLAASSTPSSPPSSPAAAWGWPPCWASCGATRARSWWTARPGRGTTFRVLFPRRGAARRRRRPAGRPPAPQPCAADHPADRRRARASETWAGDPGKIGAVRDGRRERA